MESGLGDFGVRKYDDGLGRFVSIDPLWEKYRSLSPYNYSANNPLLLKDPSGKAFGGGPLIQPTMTSEYGGHKTERKARSAGDAPHGSSHLEESFKSSAKNTAALVTKVIPETITQVSAKTYDLASIGYKAIKPDAARAGAGFSVITGLGGSANSEYTFISEEANGNVTAVGSSTTNFAAVGFDVSLGVFGAAGWFSGNDKAITASSLSGRGYTVGFGGGMLGNLGIVISVSPTDQGTWTFIGITVGGSATPYSASVQMGDTTLDEP